MLLTNILIAFILIYISIDDFLNFRIKNEVIILLIILAIIKFLIIGFNTQFIEHILYAFLIFIFIIVIYSLGIFGGGDAKLLAVIFFIIDKSHWLNFYFELMFITLVYSLLAYLKLIPLRKVTKGTKIPYGPCICAACMLNIF